MLTIHKPAGKIKFLTRLTPDQWKQVTAVNMDGAFIWTDDVGMARTGKATPDSFDGFTVSGVYQEGTRFYTYWVIQRSRVNRVDIYRCWRFEHVFHRPMLRKQVNNDLNFLSKGCWREAIESARRAREHYLAGNEREFDKARSFAIDRAVDAQYHQQRRLGLS